MPSWSWLALGVLLAGAAAGATALAQGSGPVAALSGARLMRGALAAPHGELVAGALGATLQLAGGGELRVDAGTRFRIGGEPGQNQAGGAALASARVLSLESGTLTLRLPDAAGQPVLLLGPLRLRAWLGAGELSMSASAEQVAVGARRGSARVALDEAWSELPAGNEQRVSAAQPAGQRRALLGAPGEPVLSRHLLVEGDGSESRALAHWGEVPGASAYQLRVCGADGAVLSEQSSALPRAQLSVSSAGRLQVVACALDDAGICGPPSPPAALRVLGVRGTPVLHRGPGGSLRLMPGQRVALLGAEGLELGYPPLDSYLPAPPSLGLIDRRPIGLVIREPGGGGESVTLRLEPMSVVASIRLGDYAYGWPPEGLELSVTLEGSDGHAVPAGLPVTVRVTLDAVQLELLWQRDQNQLSTFVERPDGVGPWMLRVEVLDESLASIGSNVTEIAYRTVPATRSH